MNRTWVEINIDNLLFNLENIKKKIPNNTQIIAAVKANAYGHDSIEISKVLEKHISMFGVASVDEAIELRSHSINSPILILSPTVFSDIDKVIDYNLIPNINSYDYALSLNNKCKHKNIIAPVHIEIDTGMNRTGIDYKIAVNEIEKMVLLDNIEIEGIFSHFAEAEKIDGFTIEQKQRFDIIINKLKEDKVSYKYAHFANSAAIVNHENTNYDFIRPGIMLYGIHTSDDLKDKIELKPVMSMKSRICQIRVIDKGDTVSYTRSFTAPKRMRVATVLIGYGDGYPRLLSNRVKMYIKNREVPVIGNICMDLSVIDISDFNEHEIQVNDEIEIFGDHISISKLSEISGMINYELLTGIGPRVPRIFVKNKKPYMKKNIMFNANRGTNGQ